MQRTRDGEPTLQAIVDGAVAVVPGGPAFRCGNQNSMKGRAWTRCASTTCKAAAERGVASLLSFRLFVQGKTLGALGERPSDVSREAYWDRTIALLVKASQSNNIKIVDLARWLVEEHEAGLHRP